MGGWWQTSGVGSGSGELDCLSLPLLTTHSANPPHLLHPVSHSGWLGSWSIVTYCQLGSGVAGWGGGGVRVANAGPGLIIS